MKMWKIINSPIVILAIAIAVVYFWFLDPAEHLVYRSTGGSSSSSSMSFFSYFDGKKYESKVLALDVAKGSSLNLENQDLPISPQKAIALARASLTPPFPALADLSTKSVALSAVDENGHYIYVLEFGRSSDPSNSLRTVVLMDGTVIKPL